MQEIDAQMAGRVWNRVRGGQEERLPLRVLISRERELAAGIRALARQLRGRPGQLLEGLAKQSEQHVLWLKGMCLCDGAPAPHPAAMSAGAQPAQAAVRRLYSRTLALLGEYSRRQEDGQYGAVFGRMAGQEAEACAKLLELMAAVGGK